MSLNQFQVCVAQPGAVVQTMAGQRYPMDKSLHWVTQLVSPTRIRWKVINPVNSAIQRLNNWSLLFTKEFISDINKENEDITGLTTLLLE